MKMRKKRRESKTLTVTKDRHVQDRVRDQDRDPGLDLNPSPGMCKLNIFTDLGSLMFFKVGIPKGSLLFMRKL